MTRLVRILSLLAFAAVAAPALAKVPLNQNQHITDSLVAGRAAVAVVAAGSWRQWVAMAKAVGVLGSITPLNSRTAC